MKIIENALNEELFNDIYKQVSDIHFPWYFSETAYEDEGDDLYNFSYSHLVYLDGQVKSTAAASLWKAVKEVVEKAGEEIQDLVRIRLGSVNITKEPYVHKPHVDCDFKHKTGLIYLNTSKAPTRFYKERYDNSGVDIAELHSSFAEEALVYPEKNKAVIFDGEIYHSSTTPQDVPRRLVVNFNYIPKESGE